MPEKPIGRCGKCGHPSHDIDDLNMPCDCVRGGFICSTAEQEWKPCDPCLGTGKSLIYPKDGTDVCPVCRGTGWSTEYDLWEETAQSESVVVDYAVENMLRGDWPPPIERTHTSALGSFGILRLPAPKTSDFEDLKRHVLDAFPAEDYPKKH